jgi:hypothetical protein
MPGDVMLYVKQTLNAEQRKSLLKHLEDRLHVAGDVHTSGKPHLLFAPVDPVKASPHAVLGAVRERGYDARLVDL